MRPAAYRKRLLPLLTVCAVTASRGLAQTTVHGIVTDSLSGRPFAGATVELVPTRTPWLAGFTARSDSAGRYSIAAVPAGSYYFGFQHPRLDSLGLDPVTSTLEVRSASPRLTANLALPSAYTFAAILCGARRGSTTSALVGRVFDANDGRAISRGTVLVRWGELSVGDSGLRNDNAQRTVAVRSDGRYIACNVPTDAPLLIQAISGNLTDPSWTTSRLVSGGIEVTFAYDKPLLHRDLYVGMSETDSAAPSTSQIGSVGPVRKGSSRLVGRVVNEDGAPVVGARVLVRIAAAQAVSDSSGVFRISGLPIGTQSVEVTALGFAPTNTGVDLLPDVETPLTLQVARRVQTLEEVNVVARRADPSGFYARRAKGLGYFVDSEQIRKWGPPDLGSALSMAPMLRKNLTGRGGCTPVLFLDGVRIDYMLNEVLNGLELGGIEVYANPADIPPQFASPGSRPGARTLSGGCAVIVIWTLAFVR